MGWKNLKDHFKISHIVQVTRKGICIGSPYIHDIMIIGLDGEIKKGYLKGDSGNVDLDRYQKELSECPAKVKELIEAPDVFEKSIKVYTYEGANIIEKFCDEVGWPNATHDGEMMYANTFSEDKAQVIEWAKKEALAGIKLFKSRIEEHEADIVRFRKELAVEEENFSKLNLIDSN